MPNSLPPVVALAGDSGACAVLAERLGGDAAEADSAIFTLGVHRYRLAGGVAQEFLASMAADPLQLTAAMLVIDVDRGLTIEARSAVFLLQILDRSVVVVIDNVADDARFARAAKECVAFLACIDVTPVGIIPLAAIEADDRPSWYDGPTLADALAGLSPARPRDLSLRVSLAAPQSDTDVGGWRGRVECGRLAAGDTLVLSPANLTTGLRALIDPASGGAKDSAEAGETVEIIFDTDVSAAVPFQLASHLDAPPIETDVFRTRLFWTGVAPLDGGGRYRARLHGGDSPVTVQSIDRIVSTPDFAEQDGKSAVAGDIVECVLRAPEMVALDSFESSPPTGWLAVYDGDELVAAGTIGMAGYADQRGLITVRATNVTRAIAAVSAEVRTARNRHRGGVLWLTGLSGAGKSTIATEAERRLFEMGYQVCVLEGDNLRHGLCADLGFSPEDRAENIRRIGEVGALFARTGMIVITAFISPYRSDRDRARAVLPEAFAEVYVRAVLATCEARDPKGLYKKARAGEIPQFTGISAPYEAPESPELVIATDGAELDASVDTLLQYIEAEFALTASAPAA